MITGDNMTRLNTILFDLDGTIVDSNEIIIRSYEHTYRTHLPNQSISRQTIIDQIGPTLEDTLSQYADNEKMLKDLIDSYLYYYRKHEHEYFKLYEGILPTLNTLKKEGYNLAIVTSKFEESALPSIQHFGLDHIFDCVVTLDQVNKPKPEPESVHKALQCFTTCEKAIMIGDNPGDITAGKNAGILSAGVAWSIKGSETLENAGADYILETPEDIFNIIKKEQGR